MATRVNTRFVMLLCAITVLVVTAITFFWYGYVRENPQKLVTEARELMHHGGSDNILQAAVLYQHAVARRPRNVSLLQESANALEKMPVKDSAQAKQVVHNVLGYLKRASDLKPDDSQLLLNFYRQEFQYGLRLNAGSFISRLQSEADAKLQNDPHNVVARKYRGIAQTLLLQPTTENADRMQAKSDLESAIMHDGKDYESMYYLSLWHLNEAHFQTQNQASKQKIAAQYKQVKWLTQAILKNVEKSSHTVQRKLWAARLLANPLMDKTDQARSLVQSLESAMLSQPHPARRVLIVTSLLQQVDRQPVKSGNRRVTQGMMRAKKLLEVASKAYPNDAVFHLRLGELLNRSGQIDQAIDQYAKARSLGQQGTAIQVLLADQNETQATEQEADLLITQVMNGSPSNKAKLAKASDLIDSLAKQLSGDAPMVNFLRGKLDLAQNKNDAAAVKLWRAIQQINTPSPGLRLLCAEAFRRTHQMGAAENQLSKVLKMMPDNAEIYARLATLYMATGSPDKAASLLKTALKLAPDNESVRLAQADLYLNQGKPKQALEIYKTADLDKHPPVVSAIVRCYEALGQKDQAKAFLQARLAKKPRDLQTLALLLPRVKSSSARTALLKQAEAAGANKAAVKTLETLAMNLGNTAVENQKRDEAMIARVKDPAHRALARAQLYLHQGDQKKARAALAKAAKLNPDLEGVVRMQFNFSLEDKNWHKAQQLANKAGSMNLDQAKGAFFSGRLSMARHHYANAVASFQRGLSARPVFSQGQLWLGNALMAQGNQVDAATAYQKAVDQQPNNIQAWLALAQLKHKQGDHSIALDDLKHASQLSNDASVIERYLAYEQRYGSPAKALKHREQLAAKAPQLYANRRAIAVLQAQLKQTDAAKKTVNKLVADEGLTLNNLKAELAVDAISGHPQAGEKAAAAYLAKRGKKADVADYLTIAHYRLGIGDKSGAMKAFHQAMAVQDPNTQPATRDLADLLFAQGKYAEAQTYYQKLIAAHPENKKIKLRLAETLVRLSKLDEASKLVDSLKDNPEALALKGMIAEHRKDYGTAVRLFTQAINQGESSPVVYYERARVYIAKHEISKAGADLQTAVAKNGSYLQARQLLASVALKQGDNDQAIQNLRAILQRAPQLADVRKELVSVYIKQGDQSAAKATVSDAIRRFPKQAQWPQIMGQLLARNNQLSQALTYWKQAVSLDAAPGNLASLAQGLIASNQPEKAVSVLDRYSEKLNATPMLQAIKAQGLQAIGRKQQATILFGHALDRAKTLPVYTAITLRMAGALGSNTMLSVLKERADSTRHPVWAKLMEAKLLAKNQSFDQVYALLAGLPDNLSGESQQLRQLLLGVAAYETGHYKQAQASYEAVLQKNPHDLNTINNLAFLLADQNIDPARAVKLAKLAKDLAPDNSQILDTLGWAQFKSGDIDSARQTLSLSVQKDKNAYNTYHLAQVYFKLGDKSKAKQLNDEALALARQSKHPLAIREAEQLKAALKKH